MPDTPQNRLRYYRANLADADRMDISFDTVQSKGRQVLSLAKPEPEAVAFFFEGLDPKVTSRSLFVGPLSLRQRALDGQQSRGATVVPFWIPARLTRNGEFFPPEDPRLVPWIIRGVLAPNDFLRREYPTLASVDRLDDETTWAGFSRESWSGYWRSSQAYFKAIVGQEWKGLDVEGWEVQTQQIALIPGDLRGLTGRILELYDSYLADGAPPLLNAMLRDPATAVEPVEDLLTPIREVVHFGQMGDLFPLSASQRMALTLAERTPANRVLAVNGPPGTGKTTLIQSVVANLIVKSFLEADRPPVILGSSANNKAITNILDSFKSVVPTLDRQTSLNQRWLPEIDALGHYLASNFEDNVANARQEGYWVSTNGKEGADAYSSYCVDHPREVCISYFQAQFRKHFAQDAPQTLAEMSAHLRGQVQQRRAWIESLTATSRDLLSLCAQWDESPSNLESIATWVSARLSDLKQKRDFLDGLIERFHLRPHQPNFVIRVVEALIRGPRRTRALRLRAQLSDAHLVNLEQATDDFDQLSVWVWTERESLQRLDFELTMTWSKLETPWKEIQSRIRNDNGIPEDWVTALQENLDQQERHESFWYALHGLEARWLIGRDDAAFQRLNRGEEGIKGRWSQIAYLTPVFVSTFHSLPGFFSHSKKVSEDLWRSIPLSGFADLLVIDEAGQVPPELGVVAFGLARKGLVVGDVRQLEPIAGISISSLDLANAQRANLMATRQEHQSWLDSKLGSVNGSLMNLAQRTSPFHYPTRWSEQGALLTEHRRCVPSIIEYCNSFVYDRLLNVKTRSAPGLWPALGYCHIAGESVRNQSSQINLLEARAIAHWIKKNQAQIESVTGEPIANSLGVITPFRSQRNLIVSVLNQQGIPTKGLVVGTVHALQGAERAMVIFSPVYGRNHHSGKLFFNATYNMLNVAVSRAKNHFLVFGNMQLFQPTPGRSPAGDLGRLLFASPENEILNEFVFSEISDARYEQGAVDRISTLEQHRASLRKAIQTAEKRVVIVSPFISSNAIEADNVVALIQTAVNRNVDVVVITDEFLDRAGGVLKPSSVEGRQLLQGAGAKLIVHAGIHNKTLLMDKRVLIEGSFNWLSAVRDPTSPLCRKETSIVVKSPVADALIVGVEEELGLEAWSD